LTGKKKRREGTATSPKTSCSRKRGNTLIHFKKKREGEIAFEGGEEIDSGKNRPQGPTDAKRLARTRMPFPKALHEGIGKKERRNRLEGGKKVQL